jgi:hypothetical protein
MAVKDFHFSGWQLCRIGTKPAENRDFAGFSLYLPVLSLMASMSPQRFPLA